MAGERDVESNIVSDRTRTAHRHLLATVTSVGLTPSHNSGHVRAVRLHDPYRRYLFSWIPAQHHLTFYIRKPALALVGTLRQTIAQTGLSTQTNPAGEIKVRVQGETDAIALIAWLANQEFPAPDARSGYEPQSSAREEGKLSKTCPECGHHFRGNGWDGIDAHWRARHEWLIPYAEAWPLLRAGTYRAAE